MLKEDFKEHFNNIVKSMTNKCHKKCFDLSKMDLDKSCVFNCFDKYLFAISFNFKILEEIGKKNNSEIIDKVILAKYNFKDLNFFPYGGINPFNYLNWGIIGNKKVYTVGSHEFIDKNLWR